MSKLRQRHYIGGALVVITAMFVFVIAASSANLPGSAFEIDGAPTGANLVVDGGAGALDWANVNDVRRFDLPTGGNDDSYSGGTKEDTACPGTTTGSIPNNKSDLLAFGGYFEPEADGPGWLHVFWSRVNDPSGTTNMDFEFNKSTQDCDAGGSSKNVTRTVGDILLQYDITQGGATATLSKREWLGTQWSDAVPLTATQAIGTINTQAIGFANSDGLLAAGSQQARTFGEASFDLSQVFDPTKCESFGSAMLKSRSSDSFTSQLKDFIAPINVNIRNCAKVIVRKQTEPQGETQQFGFTKAFGTDPVTGNTFSLADDGVQTYNDVLFGEDLTVSEDAVTATGWEFVSLNCSASTGVVPDISGQTATFDLDDASDVVDCTFTNRLQQGAITIRKQTIKSGNAGLQGAEFSITGPGSYSNNVTSGADGTICVDGLAWGNYTVTETKAPNGYAIDDPTGNVVVVDNNANCSDDLDGETITFDDTPLTDVLVRAKGQVDGQTASSIECVDSDGDDIGNSPQPATGFSDPAQVDAVGLEPGTYTCTIVVDP